MSSRIIDNVIAYKLLRMLVTPFVDTEAFKLGIIDAHGNILIKSSHFTTDEQRNAFTFLNRLVFNVKKMINKFGGENRLKSMAVALWLIRETYQSGLKTTSQLEPKFKKLIESNIHLVEEEILVGKFLKEDGVTAIGGAPANNTSGPVATQEPKIYPNSKKKPIFGMARRKELAVKEVC